MLASMLVVCIGAIMGMVINYLADVLPFSRRFSAANCPVCGRTFKINEYLFSFKCPQCKSRPSVRHFIVLLLGITASICAALFAVKGLNYWSVVILLTFLGLIIVIDIEHKAVLNETSIIGAILMAVLGILMNGLWMTLLGGVVGYGFMLVLYFCGGLFTKWLAHRRHQEIDEVALGFGDVNVTGFLGLLVGWPDILSMIVFAILMGGVFSILYILILSLAKRFKSFSAIPYAPFLVISAILILFIR